MVENVSFFYRFLLSVIKVFFFFWVFPCSLNYAMLCYAELIQFTCNICIMCANFVHNDNPIMCFLEHKGIPFPLVCLPFFPHHIYF